MSGLSVEYLKTLSPEKIASIAKSAGASPETKSACKKALEEVGKDINGDGKKDENDYDVPAMKAEDLRALEAGQNPTKDEKVEQSKQDTKDGMKSGGDDDKSASKKYKTVTEWTEKLTVGADIAALGAESLKGAIARSALAAAHLAIASAMKGADLNGDQAEDMQKFLEENIEEVKQQMKDGTGLFEEALGNIEKAQEEDAAEVEQNNEIGAGMQEENLQYSEELAYLADKIESGEADESDKARYAELIGLMTQNSADVTAINKETWANKKARAAVIGENFEVIGSAQDIVNNAKGMLEVNQDLANITFESTQEAHEAAEKGKELAENQAKVDAGMAAKELMKGTLMKTVGNFLIGVGNKIIAFGAGLLSNVFTHAEGLAAIAKGEKVVLGGTKKVTDGVKNWLPAMALDGVNTGVEMGTANIFKNVAEDQARINELAGQAQVAAGDGLDMNADMEAGVTAATEIADEATAALEDQAIETPTDMGDIPSGTPTAPTGGTDESDPKGEDEEKKKKPDEEKKA